MVEAESLGPRYDLTCWYVNLRRTAELLGPRFPISGFKLDSMGFLEQHRTLAVAKTAYLDWMALTQPSTLGKLILSGGLRHGAFFTHYSDFYCKRSKDYSVFGEGEVTCYSKLSAPFGYERVVCPLRTEHFTSTSAYATLSGRVQLFLLAAVHALEGGVVTAIPYLVASMLTQGALWSTVGSRWPSRLEVFLEAIDAFQLVKEEPTVRRVRADLEPLRAVSELALKVALGEILNEPTIPADWGGERSDLFTTNVSIEGARISTAFLLKGPAKFHRMTFADLGKNGDQIDRLFTEPADLLVLQHCHEIDPPVRNVMRVYASQMPWPRLFMLVDGYDTVRLLKAYKKCGF